MSSDQDPTIPAPSGVDETLKERGARYGRFEDHARIAMSLIEIMRAAKGWNCLKEDHKHAFSVIADKIARTLNGDPEYIDNALDIAGYAMLVYYRQCAEQGLDPKKMD